MQQETQAIIGLVAGVLSLAGYIPYIYSILKGVTRPNRATWIIWTLVGGLLAFSFMAEGDRHAMWVPLAYFVGPFVTMLLSFRYGYAAWSRLDTLCMVVAVASVVPWLLSHDARLTLLVNVLIDATGAIPTVVKSYREPETEDCWAWLVFFVANTLELFAIETWNFAAIYPGYLFLLAGSITFFTLPARIRR